MTLGFLGAGNMAGALIAGGARGAHIFDVNKELMRSREAEFACVAHESARELILTSDIILLAVKPNVAPGLIRENADAFAGKAVISIVAGLTCEKLKALLPDGARYLRVMPNTPALVGAGMTALTRDNTLSAAEFAFAEGLFKAVGETTLVDERLLDAVTGVSGSGPAYAVMFIEAMADGGVAMGLPRAAAYKLAAQTVLGAAKMVIETGRHPGELKDMVTSPAGTTIDAVMSLENDGLRAAVMNAVVVCAEKSAKMAKESK